MHVSHDRTEYGRFNGTHEDLEYIVTSSHRPGSIFVWLHHRDTEPIMVATIYDLSSFPTPSWAAEYIEADRNWQRWLVSKADDTYWTYCRTKTFNEIKRAEQRT